MMIMMMTHDGPDQVPFWLLGQPSRRSCLPWRGWVRTGSSLSFTLENIENKKYESWTYEHLVWWWRWWWLRWSGQRGVRASVYKSTWWPRMCLPAWVQVFKLIIIFILILIIFNPFLYPYSSLTLNQVAYPGLWYLNFHHYCLFKCQHCRAQPYHMMSRLVGEGQCEDVDECATDNGGCQQVTYALV